MMINDEEKSGGSAPPSPNERHDDDFDKNRHGFSHAGAADDDDKEDAMMMMVQMESAGASLPHPGELERKSDSLCRGRRMWYALGFTFFVIVLIVAISVPVATKNQDSSVRKATTPEVVVFLLVNGVADTLLVETYGTPQFKAAVWIAEQDGANLPVPSINTDINDEQAYEYIFRYVMALNYFAMGGPNSWLRQLNWLSEENVCSWQGEVFVDNALRKIGVFCNNDEGPPTDLRLNHNGLSGKIPMENGVLTSLKTIDLQGSMLSGTIPERLCHLKNLEILALSTNSLTGEVPTCLGSMTALRWLFVNTNLLHGTLPEFSSPSLQALVIEDNMFTGSLEHSLSSALTNLTKLYVDRNMLEGDIYTFFASRQQLEEVDMSDNNFTITNGVVPTQLFAMPKLEYLDLSQNPLQGSIPDIILSKGVTNTKLKFLSLRNNTLSGKLPDLSQMIVLETLDLSSNDFVGTLHAAFGTMSSLVSLFLSDNRGLTAGSVPPTFTGLSNLKELSLRSSNRTGQLPPTSLLSKNLVLLDLGSNDLNGSIPPDYGTELTNLEYLLLNGNSITGKVPSSLSKLGYLVTLFVDGTNLTGEVDFLCNPKTKQKSIKLVYADCYGPEPEVNCSCCKCCYRGDVTGCSNPLPGNINASYANSFRRGIYHIYDL